MYKFRKRIVVFAVVSAVCAASFNVYAAVDSRNLSETAIETAKRREKTGPQEAGTGQGRENTALQEAKTAEKQENTGLQEAETEQGRENAALQEAETAEEQENTGLQEAGTEQGICSCILRRT